MMNVNASSFFPGSSSSGTGRCPSPSLFESKDDERKKQITAVSGTVVPSSSMNHHADLSATANEFTPSQYSAKDGASLGTGDNGLKATASEFQPLTRLSSSAIGFYPSQQATQLSSQRTALSYTSPPFIPVERGYHMPPPASDFLPADLVPPYTPEHSSSATGFYPSQQATQLLSQRTALSYTLTPFIPVERGYHMPPPASDFLPTDLVPPYTPEHTAFECAPQNAAIGSGGIHYTTSKRQYTTPDLCRFFLMGACRKGLDCPFQHDSKAAEAYSNNPGLDRDSNKNEACHHIQILDNGIRCEFGPGVSILKLEFPTKESVNRSILISGLPSATTEQDIEVRLSPFGALISLTFQVAAKKQSSYALATYEEAKMAKDATDALHGSVASSWIGLLDSGEGGKIEKFKRPQLETDFVSVTLKNTCTGEAGVKARVQWYAPSRIAWVHFRLRSEATKAAKVRQGKELHGRKLTAKFQQPTWNQTMSFTVWLGSINESTTKSHLTHFIESKVRCKITSIDMDQPPFRSQHAPGLVKKLLVKHGGALTHFEMDNENIYSTKQKALVRFANASDAKKACQYFEMCCKIKELGGTKLFLQRIFSTKYSVPLGVFDVIKEEINNTLSKQKDARASYFPDVMRVAILVQTNSEAGLSAIKGILDSIVQGEPLRDPLNGGRIVWTKYVSSHLYNKLGSIVGAKAGHVVVDRRRQEVRIFGSQGDREDIQKLLLAYCEEMRIEVHSVPISQTMFETILTSGRETLDRLTRATGSRKVSIDIKSRSLLVEGSSLQAKKVKEYLQRSLGGDGKKEQTGDVCCPVCFCPPGDVDGDSPDEIAVELSCKHVYCSECFDSWLGNGNLCDFPIKCLAEECSSPVTLTDLNQYLKRQDFTSLLHVAVDDHVRKNIQTLQFCPSNSCNGICEEKEECGTLHCSTCSQAYCKDCKVDHSDMTCKEYELASQPPDKLRMKIIDEILTLRCPRCQQAFLDFEGCFAVSCSTCPCKFCGWCLHDCGDRDAHPHVSTCPYKPKGADTYFGSKAQFDVVQNKIRKQKLQVFLAERSKADQTTILASIQKDLDDLKLAM